MMPYKARLLKNLSCKHDCAGLTVSLGSASAGYCQLLDVPNHRFEREKTNPVNYWGYSDQGLLQKLFITGKKFKGVGGCSFAFVKGKQTKCRRWHCHA